jgi:curved DNA-binding protein CbpA
VVQGRQVTECPSALTCVAQKPASNTPLTISQDHEIFRVRDELAAIDGPEKTFYDFLGVNPTASQDEIVKAYRRKSKALHPDKVKQRLNAERVTKAKAKNKARKGKGVTVTKPPSRSEIKAAVKQASDMQARLGIVANILKGPERERYDHFLANGFPVWKGTGYYYNRFRPGLGTVIVGLFLFVGGGAHYLALYTSWKRRHEFAERYIKFARHAAWGDNLGINIPGVDSAPAPAPVQQDDDEPMQPMNRRQRREQAREMAREKNVKKPKGRAAVSGSATPQPQVQDGGPVGNKKRVVAENGKVLIVDSIGNVFLEEVDEEGNVEALLLDVSLTWLLGSRFV